MSWRFEKVAGGIVRGEQSFNLLAQVGVVTAGVNEVGGAFGRRILCRSGKNGFHAHGESLPAHVRQDMRKRRAQPLTVFGKDYVPSANAA
jgi:hypothetical protein